MTTPLKNTAVRILMLLILGSAASGALAAQGKKPELTDRPLEELMQLEVATVYGAAKFWQKTTQAPSGAAE
jgi:hypothetical protein